MAKHIQNPNGATASHRTNRSRQIGCYGLTFYRRAPSVVIDGQELTWKEFGQLFVAEGGYQFKLQVVDPVDDVD